jgi:hypothetical protein
MNIVNVMLWMQRNAYEESTIRKVAKLLRHLKKNCNRADPETIKFYVSKKNCGNGHKENLIEAYAIYVRSGSARAFSVPLISKHTTSIEI